VKAPPRSTSPTLAAGACLRRPPVRRANTRLRSTAAFSLVEISVVVLIISIIAALAVPHWKRAQQNARVTALANDLRVFAGAFQGYAQDRGDWPPATSAPGEIPPGMDAHLGPTSWQRVTPFGGHYAWARDTLQQGVRYRAALLLQSVGEAHVTSDRQLLVDLDLKIDDGNLDTGNFRLGFRNQPVFVLEH
jgi:prepilin-type N-terminal cleavage/methylation domain-containing protein